VTPVGAEVGVPGERAADDIVAILRAEAGRNPYDRTLSDLIGELSTRSETFRTRWADHNVRFHRTGTKQLHLLLDGVDCTAVPGGGAPTIGPVPRSPQLSHRRSRRPDGWVNGGWMNRWNTASHGWG